MSTDAARSATVGHGGRAADRRGPAGVEIEHGHLVSIGHEVLGDEAPDVSQPDDAHLHVPTPWCAADRQLRHCPVAARRVTVGDRRPSCDTSVR